jgi:hypothetical protein
MDTASDLSRNLVSISASQGRRSEGRKCEVAAVRRSEHENAATVVIWPAKCRRTSTQVTLVGASAPGRPYRRDAGAQPRCPPFDGNDAHGELESGPVELFGELRDHDDPCGELIAGDLSSDLHRGAACCAAQATAILRSRRAARRAGHPREGTASRSMSTATSWWRRLRPVWTTRPV